MKLSRADLSSMRLSFFGFFAVLLFGLVSSFFLFGQKNIALSLEQAAASERSEQVGRLKQVRDEEKEIKQKSAAFGTLVQRGVVGEEQRLEWVELLKEIRDQRRLIDLQYEFLPQRVLDVGVENKILFYASTMNLKVQLLHEEDLTRLLADLRARAQALIQIKQCNISRLNATDAERASHAAQLQASCQIDWITLREVKK
ncbi:MAG: hypothetical protein V4623_03670 [Pseudomonadota bacterium]